MSNEHEIAAKVDRPTQHLIIRLKIMIKVRVFEY